MIMMAAALILSGCGMKPETIQPDPSLGNHNSAPEASPISAANTEQVTLLQTFSAHDGRVLDLAFSNGGEYLASSGQDLEIKIWDPGTGQALHSFPMRSVDMADIDISSQEDLLASGEAIWDLETRQEVLILERGSVHPAFVAFSPDGGILALARLDRETRLWDLTAGQPVDSFPKLEETRTKRMEFSPDGTLLTEGVIDGSVRIWDIESKELIRTLQYSGETDIQDPG